MFAVNVFGVQNCYSAAAKQMIKQGNCKPDAPGKIIGVSWLHIYGHAETVLYCRGPKRGLTKPDIRPLRSLRSNLSRCFHTTQQRNGLFVV